MKTIIIKLALGIAIACCLHTPLQGKTDSAPIAVNAPANSTARMVIIAMPRFPGGDISFFTDFLKGHLHYPKAAVKKKIGGDVYVRFVVDSSGYATEPEILQSPHPMLSDAVMRIFSVMPKWSPGFKEGKYIPYEFTLHIRFSPQNYKNRRKHPLTNNSEDRLILIKRGIGAIFQNCIPVDGSDTHTTTRQRKDIH